MSSTKSYELIAQLKILIEEAFSPLFNQEEIPEIIFNPVNTRIRDDRITEYVGDLLDEELKWVVPKLFEGITEVSIYEKIILFFVLFTENYSMNLEDFEANKVRIFGDEIKRISLEDEYFKGLLKKRCEKSSKKLSWTYEKKEGNYKSSYELNF